MSGHRSWAEMKRGVSERRAAQAEQMLAYMATTEFGLSVEQAVQHANWGHAMGEHDVLSETYQEFLDWMALAGRWRGAPRG